MNATTATPTDDATPTPPRTRSSARMWPREHGAWAQLGFPLACGLIVGGVAPPNLLWTLAAILAFLGHEPLLILLGQRGTRARRELGGRARRRLLAFALLALPALAAALILAAPPARFAMAVSLALCAALGRFIWTRQEKTAAGELLAVLAFASAAAPLVLAASTTARALTLTLGWAAIFAIGTLGARGVIHSRKTGRRAMLPALLAVVVVWSATCALLLGGAALSPLTAAALVPTTVLALALAARPPHPRHLRKVGFALLSASIVAAVLLVL